MSAPTKTVSDTVMERISDAINAIQADPSLRRTKTEIERLTGLSHATVARAFVQDVASAEADSVSRWRITERFQALTATTGRRSELEAAAKNRTRDVQAKNAEIAALQAERDVYAQALYAYWLTTRTEQTASTVRPIRPRH